MVTKIWVGIRSLCISMDTSGTMPNTNKEVITIIVVKIFLYHIKKAFKIMQLRSLKTTRQLLDFQRFHSTQERKNGKILWKFNNLRNVFTVQHNVVFLWFLVQRQLDKRQAQCISWRRQICSVAPILTAILYNVHYEFALGPERNCIKSIVSSQTRVASTDSKWGNYFTYHHLE